jgi:hypothetical protein
LDIGKYINLSIVLGARQSGASVCPWEHTDVAYTVDTISVSVNGLITLTINKRDPSLTAS